MYTGKKASGLTELAEVPETTDEVVVLDKSDTTMSSAGTNKRNSHKNFIGYTEYVALLTQSGTDAPTATVIKNDTGATVSWSRILTGIYTGAFSSAVLTENKTACIIQPGTSEHLSVSRSAATSVTVTSQNTSFANTDGLMSVVLVIVRIYV